MQLKRLLYFNILLCTTFLFFSCSTGYVSISVLKPAKISLPAEIRNVALYNGSCEMSPAGTFDRVTNMRLESGVNYNAAEYEYLKGIYQTLSASPRFTEVHLADSACNSVFSSDEINRTLLDSLCRVNSSDAIIVLESGDTYDDIDIYSFFSYCYVNYKVINEHNWVVYYPSAGQYIEFQLSDTLKWEGQDENCYFDSPDMYELLSEACHNSGIKAGLYMSPYWEDNVPRVIFRGINPSLQKAADLVNRNLWYEAAEIWNSMAESSNERLAARASFNIALAWERDDDLNQALLWINYADSLADNKYINEYKAVLAERLNTKEILDVQMNIE